MKTEAEQTAIFFAAWLHSSRVGVMTTALTHCSRANCNTQHHPYSTTQPPTFSN